MDFWKSRLGIFNIERNDWIWLGPTFLPDKNNLHIRCYLNRTARDIELTEKHLFFDNREAAMTIEIITILIFLCFTILLLTGLPLAWVMGATSVVFALSLFSANVIVMMVLRIYQLMLDYSLVAVPLFILMGSILQKTEIVEDMFKAIYIWSGRLRGGLAIATIIACVLMAAMVGVVGAEIVTMGLISLPMMLEKKYDYKISLGSVTAGGGMATLIPPSVVFIIYGMICGESIGALYIAGIIPGLLLAALFISYIIVSVWIKPEMAPAASEEDINVTWKEKILLAKGLVLPTILIILVLGSIYAGIATPTEAASIGCVGAIICAGVKKKFTLPRMKESLYSTVLVTCMIIWLLFGSQTIIGIYTLAGGADFVKNMLMAVPFGKWGALITMQVIWIVLGCLIDWIGILMLTMPLFLPVLHAYNVDLVWYGVVFCMNMHISYLSPPFAPSVFYLKGVVPDYITVVDIYKANLPYLWLTFIALFLVLLFPEIALWLPSHMAAK